LSEYSYNGWPKKDTIGISADLAMIETVISSKHTEALKKIVLNERVPLKDILLAVHLKIVSMLSGDRLVTTGLVANGRPDIGSDATLGLYLNTVPFKIKIKDFTWREFIKEVFKKEVQILPYRRYPLFEIVNNITSGNNIFETVFNYVDFHIYDESKLSNQKFQLTDVKVIEKTNFPFSAQFRNNQFNNEIVLTLSYDKNKFDEEFMLRVKNYYVNLLEGISNKLDSLIIDNRIVLKEEYNELLNIYSGREKSRIYSDKKFKNILEKIDDHVLNNPNGIAIIQGGEKVTYKELKNMVNGFIEVLKANGVKRQEKVGVYAPKSIELIIGILALWELGAVYVPLDTQFPKKRLEYIVNDLNIKKVLFKNPEDNEKIKEFASSIHIDKNKGIDVEVWFSIDEQDLAYVIYTSGSTGNPKGVQVTHKGIGNLIDFYQRECNLKHEDRVLMTFNIAFDGSMFDILITLGSGATLCIANKMKLIGDDLISALEEYGITAITITPTALGNTQYKKIPSLRIINVAGEECLPQLAKTWGKECQFNNLYGPSEGTISSTGYTYNSIADADRVKIPIGSSIQNVEVFILDSFQQPVPLGVEGELCLSGLGIALGYTDVEITKEKFLYNIFEAGTEGQKKYYLTGDRCKFDTNGDIYFCGRIDEQVKVNGIRIETKEIQTKLEEYLGISKALVITKKNNNKIKLVAYLMTNKTNSEKINLNDIIEYLRDYFPAYMIPEEFRELSEVPLTNNGKLDKKILDENSQVIERLKKNYVEPRNETERKISEIICSVLEINGIGIFDNLFEIGCNSLSVLGISNKVSSEFNVGFTLEKIYNNPTVEKIAIAILEEMISNADEQDFSDII
ncbi:MAG: amino acid adenylation domain-containing protein, partial [Ruminiclostridium sp.]